jgi:hypothetical protein
MRAISVASLVWCVAATVVLAACGNDKTSTSTSTPTTSTIERSTSTVTTSAYIARADAICRVALRKTSALDLRLEEAAKTQDFLTATTNALVIPGTRIRADMADHLRRLELPADSQPFETYLALFDPINSLARQRIAAGKAKNEAKSRELERLAVGTADEQAKAASDAGLRDCSKDFIRTAFPGQRNVTR